jgi:hypothetical protein
MDAMDVRCCGVRSMGDGGIYLFTLLRNALLDLLFPLGSYEWYLQQFPTVIEAWRCCNMV